VSEQRRRLEKALRGCAEGWTPQTTDPWPAIRERVAGTATSATEAEPWATFNLGFIFDRQGEYDLAVGAYQKAIDSEHSDAASKARLNLGVLFEKWGEYDLAGEAYQQAISSGHPEVAPTGMRNLRGLPMRSSAQAPTQPPDRSANFSGKGHPAP
jgi:tetratricopeptide (TPR) repeat protein